MEISDLESKVRKKKIKRNPWKLSINWRLSEVRNVTKTKMKSIQDDKQRNKNEEKQTPNISKLTDCGRWHLCVWRWGEIVSWGGFVGALVCVATMINLQSSKSVKAETRSEMLFEAKQSLILLLLKGAVAMGGERQCLNKKVHVKIARTSYSIFHWSKMMNVIYFTCL